METFENIQEVIWELGDILTAIIAIAPSPVMNSSNKSF